MHKTNGPLDRAALAEHLQRKYGAPLRDLQAEYVCDRYKALWEDLSDFKKIDIDQVVRNLDKAHLDLRAVKSLLKSSPLRQAVERIFTLGGLRAVVREIKELKSRTTNYRQETAVRLRNSGERRQHSFLTAACALELCRISIENNCGEDYAWVDGWLRRAKLPGWKENDELGSDGKAVRNLIKRHEKRWLLIKQPPPLIDFYRMPSSGDNKISPEVALRNADILFSLYNDREQHEPGKINSSKRKTRG